jgi:hypothetical protein
MSLVGTLAAQSQSGGMSAAGESRLCIVIATVVREGQRIAELDADIKTLQRQPWRWARSQPPTFRRGCCSG